MWAICLCVPLSFYLFSLTDILQYGSCFLRSCILVQLIFLLPKTYEMFLCFLQLYNKQLS